MEVDETGCTFEPPCSACRPGPPPSYRNRFFHRRESARRHPATRPPSHTFQSVETGRQASRWRVPPPGTAVRRPRDSRRRSTGTAGGDQEGLWAGSPGTQKGSEREERLGNDEHRHEHNRRSEDLRDQRPGEPAADERSGQEPGDTAGDEATGDIGRNGPARIFTTSDPSWAAGREVSTKPPGGRPQRDSAPTPEKHDSGGEARRSWIRCFGTRKTGHSAHEPPISSESVTDVPLAGLSLGSVMMHRDREGGRRSVPIGAGH